MCSRTGTQDKKDELLKQEMILAQVLTEWLQVQYK